MSVVPKQSLSLILVLSMSGGVAARPAGLPADEEIEEIQVTATRRPAGTHDVSAALTFVSSEEIAGGKLTTDSLSATPGVFLQQTTPGQGAAIVRGLKGSEVLHLVDGFRLNNAIFRNAPTQYLALVAPGTADRIEVVRGAPASLYGSDAVGGVVQVLSRVPSFDAAGSRGDLLLAFDTAEQARIVRASFDAGNERLAGLVAGEYMESGHRRIGGGQRIVPSAYVSKGARIAVAATPDDDRSWLFDFHIAEQPSTPRVDELVPGFGQSEPSSSEFYFQPNQRIFAHVRHSREAWLLDATWNVDIGWQRIVDDRITRGYQSSLRRHENNESDLFGITASAAGESTDGSWIVGVEWYHDEVTSQRFEQDTDSGQVQDVAPRFPDGSTVDQAAVYGSIVRRAGNRHSFSGGLRFSAIGSELTASSTDHDDISADLGWLFDVNGTIQLAANLGYGFRAPNVFDLGTLGERPGNRFNIPNPDLDSERITQFDIGLRHHGERVDLDVVAFTLHYTDRIASVLTGAVTPDGRDVTQSRNVKSADIHGVEVAARVSVMPQLTADVVLNYLRGEQAEAGSIDVPADRIPPFNGRFGLRYQASVSVTLEPYLLFAGRQDRLSPRDARDPRINPDGTPGWLTANVLVGWQLNDDFEVSARLENLLDRRYRVHGSGIDAPGRNLYVGVTLAW